MISSGTYHQVCTNNNLNRKDYNESIFEHKTDLSNTKCSELVLADKSVLAI